VEAHHEVGIGRVCCREYNARSWRWRVAAGMNMNGMSVGGGLKSAQGLVSIQASQPANAMIICWRSGQSAIPSRFASNYGGSTGHGRGIAWASPLTIRVLALGAMRSSCGWMTHFAYCLGANRASDCIGEVRNSGSGPGWRFEGEGAGCCCKSRLILWRMTVNIRPSSEFGVWSRNAILVKITLRFDRDMRFASG
jgi:hypothetical protein